MSPLLTRTPKFRPRSEPSEVVSAAEVNGYKVPRRWRMLLLGGAALLCGAAIGVFVLRAYRAPEPRLQRLADGTEIFYLSNSRVAPASSYPHPREIKIDGEAFVRAAAGAQPLIIRTRLMVLKVTGASALRVTARSSETGEEADVLSGQVEATKAYPSTQNEPDILLAGQEVMVNQTIDLQEQETADVPQLRAWSDALMRRAVSN